MREWIRSATPSSYAALLKQNVTIDIWERRSRAPITAQLATAVFVRISRDREGLGLGVTRQESDCRALAERLGWTVTGVFADNDLSAYSGKPRPKHQDMLQAVQAGRIQAVVAWHPERLYRRATDLEEIVTIAEAHHLQIATVMSGDLDLSSATGRMTARIIGAVAKAESERTRERVKRAKGRQALDGGYRGGGNRTVSRRTA